MNLPDLPAGLARGLDSVAAAPWLAAPLAALAELASVAAPSDCVFCGTPDAVMCRVCRRAFRSATVRPFAAQDGAEGLPLLPDGSPLPVTAAGPYAREVSAAVLAFKDHQRTPLLGVLGPALAGALRVAAQAVPRTAADTLLLVPVPSSRAARARRGYAPVELLLAWVARHGLLPPGVEAARVLRVRPGPPWRAAEQKGKGRRARAATAAGLVMLPGTDVSSRHVVLLDDVLTTGSTLARAHRCLGEAGALVDAAVVLAATAPPRQAGPGPDRGPAAPAREGHAAGGTDAMGRIVGGRA